MVARRLWTMGVGCAVAVLTSFAALAAEGDRLSATIDKPAIVTAVPTTTAERTADQPAPSVTLYVTGYQPPRQPPNDSKENKYGTVSGLVSVQRPDGTEQEIGSFGVFPQTAFKAEASNARRYSFPLPKDLARGPVTLKVSLVPTGGTGEGAQLEVGRAEIR